MRFKEFKNVKIEFPNHSTNHCGQKLNGEYIHKYPPVKEKKPKVKMYNKNGLRQIIVPSRKVQAFPEIWSNKKYEKLNDASYVLSNKEKLQMMDEAQRKQDELFFDSLKRKETLQRSKLEQRAVPGSKLYNMEHIAARRSMYILQRALDLRQEQEDNIKYANRVILLGKCVNVRNNQLQEKELMKKELQEEEDRIQIKDKTGLLNAFEMLKEQIREHEHHAFLEKEHKKEENRLILKRLAEMKEEDEEQKRKKLLEQLKVRKELQIANEQLLQIKKMKIEEERIGDCRIEEFVRLKALREAEHKRIVAEQKAQRDRNTALLQQLQEKMNSQKSAGDDLREQKIQREFQRKQNENDRLEELKRKKVIEDLKNGRQQQVENLIKGNKIEQQIEESDYNKYSKIANDLYEKDLERRRIRDAAAKKYRKELLAQIHYLEADRIHQIKQKFEDRFTLKYETEKHDLAMKSALEKKIERLHGTNVPDCVIKDIQRMLHM
ncbi:hypothetical protein FQR65_LT04001 [Abscondita terminalis]|nr:hypothetical protein FQR65_LT04001 [Abscondita terminalis]